MQLEVRTRVRLFHRCHVPQLWCNRPHRFPGVFFVSNLHRNPSSCKSGYMDPLFRYLPRYLLPLFKESMAQLRLYLFILRTYVYCSLCTTNFPVLRRTRPDAKCIVTSEPCVFRKISSNRTIYSRKCISPAK